MEHLIITALSIFFFPVVTLLFIVIALASLGKSLGIRQKYVQILLKVFEVSTTTKWCFNPSTCALNGIAMSALSGNDQHGPFTIEITNNNDMVWVVIKRFSKVEPEKCLVYSIAMWHLNKDNRLANCRVLSL